MLFNKVLQPIKPLCTRSESKSGRNRYPCQPGWRWWWWYFYPALALIRYGGYSFGDKFERNVAKQTWDRVKVSHYLSSSVLLFLFLVRLLVTHQCHELLSPQDCLHPTMECWSAWPFLCDHQPHFRRFSPSGKDSISVAVGDLICLTLVGVS